MKSSTTRYIVSTASVALATFLVTMLLVNIETRKQEGRQTYLELVKLNEDTVEPSEWGKNFPR